jgi:putative ABC transport system permease protein
MNDLKFALRQLLKNPGFATVAVLTLALGIGANTAIFSIVNAVLLRPLPFKNPDQLVMLWQEYPKRGWPAHVTFSMPNYVDVRTQSRVLENAGAFSESAHTLAGDAEPVRLNTLRLSASLLPTLGVQPKHGRNFREEEDRQDAERVALLSEHLWRNRFGADPSVVGRTIFLNDESVAVVGVLPRDFRIGEEKPDLCLPLRLDPKRIGRGQRGLQVIARLKGEITVAQAEADMAILASQLAEVNPWVNGDVQISVVPVHEQFVGKVRTALLVLLGAVAFVLLIACANVANLLLARAAGRRQELAIRLALGAGRWQVIRQLLVESAVLAIAGGTLGLLLGRWSLETLSTVATRYLPQAGDVALDGRVLAFTLLVAVATAFIFGLFPAIQASRTAAANALKDSSKGSTDGLGRQRLRGWLVISEVALAAVLLIGAGLLLRSFARLQSVSTGFDAANLLTVETVLTGRRYNDAPATRLAFHRELMQRVRQLPGVKSASVGTALPFVGGMDAAGLSIEGRTFSADEFPLVNNGGVAANYFQTLGVPVIQGRYFEDSDDERAPNVAIINLAMARKYWPEENPLGKRIRPDGFSTNLWFTIVGVTQNIKNGSLQKPAQPEMYWPYSQNPVRGHHVLIRTAVPPLSLAQSVRRELAAVDGNLATSSIKTMEQRIDESVAGARFQSVLLGVFAALALLLAAVGIYGVVSVSVSQRRRELGIRVALGARLADVHKLVLGQGMRPVTVGIVLGGAGALGLTRLLDNLLFEVSASDPATFLAVALILSGVALAACYLPARRAAKVDPMEALRYE